MSYRAAVPLDRGGCVMRSVKVERKPRRVRARKAGRRAQRSARRARRRRSRRSASASSRNDDLSARVLRAAQARFAFAPPDACADALLLRGSLCSPALFVGGYVGRRVHGVERRCRRASSPMRASASRRFTLRAIARTPPDDDPRRAGLRARPVDLRRRCSGGARAADAARLGGGCRSAAAAIRIDIASRIVEKLPFALWQAPNGALRRRALRRRRSPNKGVDDFPHLPLFVGDGAPRGGADIVDAVAHAPRRRRARARRCSASRERRWNLILDDGVVVKLPEEGWQQAARRARASHRRQGHSGARHRGDRSCARQTQLFLSCCATASRSSESNGGTRPDGRDNAACAPARRNYRPIAPALWPCSTSARRKSSA